MLKRIAAIALGSLVFVAFAQGPTVSPVHGNGTDQEDSGTSSASVDQRVNLHLPPTVALHLDVSELVFDMRHIGNTDDYVCVYGALEDADSGIGYHGQRQWLPLGTSYAVNKDWTAESDPTIEILDATGIATSYPPIEIGSDGELLEDSKNHFVCYQTFILQKFSNISDWTLTATRSGEADFDMYIQDNTYCSFNSGATTGFYRIGVGDTLNLLPDDAGLTNGTTGALADDCGQKGKSWLDDLVVIAVKVNGDTYGDNWADITYTISAEVPE